MTRMLLTSLVIAVSLVPLACRSKPQASSPADEPTTATIDDFTFPDMNSVLIGQEDNITDQREVASKYETLDGTRVLRFKTDLVTISANIEDVIAYFDRHFAAHPHLTDEKALADKLRDEQSVREYSHEDFLPGERDRLFFCTASLLEEGRFLITLNDTGARVPGIFACRYSHIQGPMDGYAGRLFLLDDKREFFRTMDRIY